MVLIGVYQRKTCPEVQALQQEHPPFNAVVKGGRWGALWKQIGPQFSSMELIFMKLMI